LCQEKSGNPGAKKPKAAITWLQIYSENNKTIKKFQVRIRGATARDGDGRIS
jgi:hypothetical protein